MALEFTITPVDKGLTSDDTTIRKISGSISKSVYLIKNKGQHFIVNMNGSDK